MRVSGSRRRAAAAFISALLVTACSLQATTPGPSIRGTSSQTGEPLVAPGEVRATIFQAIEGPVTAVSNAASDAASKRVAELVHDGLYVLDDRLRPVPLLAGEPCTVAADELTWTCTLKEGAGFHDGTPVTAADVAFSFQLADSPNCTYARPRCLGDFIQSVEAVDERTVTFRLAEAYAPFAAIGLAAVAIEPKAAIQAAYDQFRGRLGEVTADQVIAIVNRLTVAKQAVPSDPAACEAAAAEATAILDRAEIAYGSADAFAVRDDPGTPERDETDPGTCSFADSLVPSLSALGRSLQSQGADAVAAVYDRLTINRQPIGAGPYMVESTGPDTVVLRAFEGYHLGSPATSTIELPVIPDAATAAQALAAGEVEWVNDLTPLARSALESAMGEGSVKFAEYGESYAALMYNLHESTLLPDGRQWQGAFFDLNVRRAVQLCVDKPSLVAFATDGGGVPIESDIPSASWTHNEAVVAPARDPQAARALIESSERHHWTLGADGIYVNEAGERLSASVLVRSDQQDRLQFLNLFAEQVRECGIEVGLALADFQTVVIPALEYPHIPPGGTEPWDAYFGTWPFHPDPDPSSFFHSSQCTTDERPRSNNFVCLQDTEVDRHIEEGLATFDLDARAEIYREYQVRIQELQPYLFAWSYIQADAMDSRLIYADGSTPWLGSPNWYWRRHMLVVETGD